MIFCICWEFSGGCGVLCLWFLWFQVGDRPALGMSYIDSSRESCCDIDILCMNRGTMAQCNTGVES